MSTTTTYPKTIKFDYDTFQTRHIAARVQCPRPGPLEDWRYFDSAVESELMEAAARRQYGPKAWVYGARRDSWAEDFSQVDYDVTVGVGRTQDGMTTVCQMRITVMRDEVRAAADAVAAYKAAQR